MIKLNATKDMRIKILLYLEKEDYALEQISANEFLSMLKTVNNKADLGTIRRSLRDLCKEGFIMETNNTDIIHSCHLETTGKPLRDCNFEYSANRANPSRFIEKFDDAPKIPEIYLGITLKGKSFLMERRIAENEHELIQASISDLKHRRSMRPIEWFFIAISIIVSVIGLAISLIKA